MHALRLRMPALKMTTTQKALRSGVVSKQHGVSGHVAPNTYSVTMSHYRVHMTVGLMEYMTVDRVVGLGRCIFVPLNAKPCITVIYIHSEMLCDRPRLQSVCSAAGLRVTWGLLFKPWEKSGIRLSIFISVFAWDGMTCMHAMIPLKPRPG